MTTEMPSAGGWRYCAHAELMGRTNKTLNQEVWAEIVF